MKIHWFVKERGEKEFKELWREVYDEEQAIEFMKIIKETDLVVKGKVELLDHKNKLIKTLQFSDI